MKFATVVCRGRVATVLQRDDKLVDLGLLATRVSSGLTEFAFPIGRELVRAWEIGDDLVRSVADAAMQDDPGGLPLCDLGATRFLPVVLDTRQVLAVGLNYMDHCLEQGRTPPGAPMLFAKLPSCLIGHREPIVKWPLTGELDFEGELAVIIGKGGRGIPEGEALSYCFGYSVMNDVTARELQKNDRQWIRGKGLDSFGPLGPFMATRDEVPDPQDLRIRTWVNGELRQDCSTSQMIAGVARVVSYASEAITLQPGDVITTGTPSGVGVFADPPCFLEEGDTVEVEIGGVGRLVNKVAGPLPTGGGSD